MHQIYIDILSIRGNIINYMLWWDWKTRMIVSIEVIGRTGVSLEKFRVIGFMAEVMRRSDLDFVMTKEQFINIQFKEFPGLNIEVVKIDF